MKDLLLKLVDELQDLRANQVVLSFRAGVGTSLAEASDAKRIANEQVSEIYDELRKRIVALPL